MSELEQVAMSELWRVYQTAQQQMDGTVTSLARALRMLRKPINQFFTHVYVNTDDVIAREARLALLRRIAVLPDGIADLSLLQGF